MTAAITMAPAPMARQLRPRVNEPTEAFLALAAMSVSQTESLFFACEWPDTQKRLQVRLCIMGKRLTKRHDDGRAYTTRMCIQGGKPGVGVWRTK